MRKLLQFLNEDLIDHKKSIKYSLWASTALVLISHQSLGNPMLKFADASSYVVNASVTQTPIRGKVQDAATKEPIAGATIRVVGKTLATSSDAEGNFQINAALNDVLEITYVGFSKQSVNVTSTSLPLVVGMQGQSGDLDEVVVTGYSTQRKKDLTGSVSVVDVNQLKSTPAASAVESLQGRATGVQVVTDGAPGATPQIKIRGYSTINNNEPLYVIDGVPYEGKLSWLNQNDIESLQVLKDASAASIYGSRANNGVIIVTTKSGKTGKPQINFDSYYGIQSPNKSRFPKMLSPQQILDINNGLSKGNEVLPEYLLAGAKIGTSITPADVDMSKYNYADNKEEFYQITKANKAGTNWFDALSRNAPTQSYQLSATGGDVI
jgi:TonB-dependent SusC/RagA subfamily outer membrane receptor